MSENNDDQLGPYLRSALRSYQQYISERARKRESELNSAVAQSEQRGKSNRDSDTAIGSELDERSEQ